MKSTMVATPVMATPSTTTGVVSVLRQRNHLSPSSSSRKFAVMLGSQQPQSQQRKQTQPASTPGVAFVDVENMTPSSPRAQRRARGNSGNQTVSPSTVSKSHHARARAILRGNESTAKKSLKSLHRLRRSNAVLERVLAEQKDKEHQLECNLRVLETSLKRSKDNQLRETVRALNSSLFLLIVGALLWGNWTMFAPHLDAMIMACLVSAILRDIQSRIINVTEFIQTAMYRQRTSTQFMLLSCVALMESLFWLGGGMAYSLALLTCLTLFSMLMRYSSSRALSATVLTLIVTMMICFPLAFVVQSCAGEMESAAKFLLNLLQNHDKMQDLANRLNQVAAIRWTMQQVFGKSVIDSQDLNGWIKSVAGAFTANSALGLVSNASNLIWAFGTFAATLFSLLQLDLERLWETQLANISPFSSDDNVELYQTVRTSTWQVFAGSASIGIMHGVMTYFALCIVESPLCVLPAFASCCLAVAPFFGSWLPLVPFVAGFVIADRPVHAMFVAAVQVVAFAVLNPWLSSKFPPSARFIGGLPIVAGLFAWGVCGIVYGPLIVGLSFVTANIYLRYMSLKPTSQQQQDLMMMMGDEFTDLDETNLGCEGDDSFMLGSPPAFLNSSFVSNT